MNLLVAVDLSAASKRVVEAACDVATAMDGDITIFYVAEPNPNVIGFETGPVVVLEEIASEHHREHAALATLANVAEARGVSSTTKLIPGTVVDTVIEQADAMSSGMIVVGSHGHGALFDMVMGSYSQGIIRRAGIPVLVVPTRDDEV